MFLRLDLLLNPKHPDFGQGINKPHKGVIARALCDPFILEGRYLGDTIENNLIVQQQGTKEPKAHLHGGHPGLHRELHEGKLSTAAALFQKLSAAAAFYFKSCRSIP